MFYVLVLLLGITAGLRAAMPLAALAWAANLGWLNLSGTWAAFVGNIWVTLILSLFAIAELVTDQLPNTPSRKVPPQFAARVISGAVVGLVAGLPSGSWIAGLLIGAVGAVIGTFAGAEARGRLAKAFGRDLPAGLIEDAVAILVSFLAAHGLG